MSRRGCSHHAVSVTLDALVQNLETGAFEGPNDISIWRPITEELLQRQAIGGCIGPLQEGPQGALRPQAVELVDDGSVAVSASALRRSAARAAAQIAANRRDVALLLAQTLLGNQ